MASNGMGRIVNMITTPIAETYGNATIFLVGGVCAIAALFPTLFYKIKKKVP
jgi:hypothetical protein